MLSSRLLFRLFIALITVLSMPGYGQEKISYQLQAGYDSYSNGYVLKPGQRIGFSWALFPDTYGSTSSLNGTLQVFVSPDTVIDASDKEIYAKKCKAEFYQYVTDSISNTIASGKYFLIGRFKADDPAYSSFSKLLIRQLINFQVEYELESYLLSHVPVSEYDFNSQLKIVLHVRTECCAEDLGKLNGYLKVFLSEKQTLDGDHVEIGSFYPDQKLQNGRNKLEFESSLYSIPELKKYKYLVVSLENVYFDIDFNHKDSRLFSRPLKVISDMAELNRERRKSYPFLTYGSFEVPVSTLASADPDILLKEAGGFYRQVSRALNAAKTMNATEYLDAADSAFAHAGHYPLSTVLYVQPDVVSSLYSLYNDLGKTDSSFYSIASESEIGFRLGEAMQMGILLDTGRTRLHRKIFPVNLELTDDVEDGGYFESGNDPFQNPVLENPVLWISATVPAMNHFTRIFEFEKTDRILNKVLRHTDLIYPAVDAAVGLASRHVRARHVTAAILQNNDLWDFYLSMLKFYSQTGQYENGVKVYNTLAKWSSHERDELFLLTFWKAGAEFFETSRFFNRADSLYTKLDTYYQSKTLKDKDPVWLASAFNASALKQKTAPVDVSISAKDFIASIQKASAGSWFRYDEIKNNPATPMKMSMLGLKEYRLHYPQMISQLQEQDAYFPAADVQKDFAFALGRDGFYKEAFDIYHVTFPVENIKLTAFRGSFNEEAQLFYVRKQQEFFSRYINLLVEGAGKLSSEDRNEALLNSFHQMLFYRSFILRGNFRLLYNVSQSKDPAITKKFELWKAYKELLNQVYVSDQVNQKDVEIVKAALVETEKELQQSSRDSVYFLPEDLPKFIEIQNLLQPGEAAVEIVRITENHKIYYGDKSKYVAFLVTKEKPLPILITWDVPGEELETRLYRYYRSCIQRTIQDTLSYTKFWLPIAKALGTGIKKIYYAPDGVFNLINPQTFYNSSKGIYLFEEVQVTTVSTISSISPSKVDIFKKAVFFGFPDFIKDKLPPGTKPAEFPSRSALMQSPLAALPGTQVEVEGITNLLKKYGIDVKPFLRDQVTKKNFYSNTSSDLVHFATHGYWNDDKSTSSYSSAYKSLSQSALVLAGAQTSEGNGKFKLNRDGILTAAEIQNLNLFGTSLVVLSACETGLGEVIPGEGIYGLKRAFQRAGARNLVSSLWKVDDQATQKFMMIFYESLLVNRDLDLAMQQAMEGVKKQYPDPYYWGAFTLTHFR